MVSACHATYAAILASEIGTVKSCAVQAAAQLGFNGNIYIRLGNGTLEKSFGTSDLVLKIPNTSQTRFNIASAGKMFTAVGIGLLVDRHLIQFDAPISRYLEDLEPDVGSITVAELLNHTSGLGNYFDPRNSAVIEAAHTATDLLSVALMEPLAFAPGSKRAYSNSGFVVLGAIIERVSGLPYADFVQKEILEPLNMTYTEFDATDAAVPMSRMSPEGMREDAQAVAPVFLRSSPAGGIYSTAEDISTFLSALNDNRLLTRETLSSLLMARVDPGGGDKLYGYGFNVRRDLPRRVGHGGGAPGINAEIALYPDSKTQIIALSNRDPPTATRMVTVLEKAIFAPEPKSACAEALADPALRVPMAMLPSR
jgi:CubicO group peptidase (beta-lactamase class C family)